MSRKNSNGIIHTLAVIGESFRAINITEDGLLELLDERMFLHLFESVPDFREQGKIKYRLPNLLMLIFLCILDEGKQPYIFIEDYIEAKSRLFSRYGLIEDGQCPSHDTIRRVLSILDANTVYENTIQGFYNFLRSLENNLRKQGDYTHVSFDGKEMRGSGRSKETQSPKRNTAMLNVYDSGNKTALASIPISEKENEIPVIQDFLKSFEIKNTVFTADALHCQKKTAELIHDGKGVYVFTVKDNQQGLLEEIKARFNNPRSRIITIEQEARVIDILLLPSGYALADEWKGLRCFARMHSTKNRKSVCERFFIANTRDPRLVAEAIDLRWAIESELHKPKDCDLHEDLVRSTNKHALQNIAVLNNLALQLIYIYQSISGKEFRKAKNYFRCNPIECLNMILSVMSSEEIVNSLVFELKRRRKNR